MTVLACLTKLLLLFQQVPTTGTCRTLPVIQTYKTDIPYMWQHRSCVINNIPDEQVKCELQDHKIIYTL